MKIITLLEDGAKKIALAFQRYLLEAGFDNVELVSKGKLVLMTTSPPVHVLTIDENGAVKAKHFTIPSWMKTPDEKLATWLYNTIELMELPQPPAGTIAQLPASTVGKTLFIEGRPYEELNTNATSNVLSSCSKAIDQLPMRDGFAPSMGILDGVWIDPEHKLAYSLTVNCSEYKKGRQGKGEVLPDIRGFDILQKIDLKSLKMIDFKVINTTTVKDRKFVYGSEGKADPLVAMKEFGTSSVYSLR